jgi:hypothetical protein
LKKTTRTASAPSTLTIASGRRPGDNFSPMISTN